MGNSQKVPPDIAYESVKPVTSTPAAHNLIYKSNADLESPYIIIL